LDRGIRGDGNHEQRVADWTLTLLACLLRIGLQKVGALRALELEHLSLTFLLQGACIPIQTALNPRVAGVFDPALATALWGGTIWTRGTVLN